MKNQIEFSVGLNKDDISVRIGVKVGFVLTLGLYGGPITREMIAENIEATIEAAGGVLDFIDEATFEIIGVQIDDKEQVMP